MGKFFVGNPYHDDMCGEDGQLKLQYRYMPKEEAKECFPQFRWVSLEEL